MRGRGEEGGAFYVVKIISYQFLQICQKLLYDINDWSLKYFSLYKHYITLRKYKFFVKTLTLRVPISRVKTRVLGKLILTHWFVLWQARYNCVPYMCFIRHDILKNIYCRKDILWTSQVLSVIYLNIGPKYSTLKNNYGRRFLVENFLTVEKHGGPRFNCCRRVFRLTLPTNEAQLQQKVTWWVVVRTHVLYRAKLNIILAVINVMSRKWELRPLMSPCIVVVWMSIIDVMLNLMWYWRMSRVTKTKTLRYVDCITWRVIIKIMRPISKSVFNPK